MHLLKRTPLYDLYAQFGAKTIDFGGWEMPVQFRGILAEHEAVRTKVGLFDVSHMGEFEVSGPHAYHFLQNIVTNDVGRLEISQALYSPMCYEDGGTVDDVLIYRLEEEKYLVVVNAGNIEKDEAWFLSHDHGAVIVNRSQETAQLALQGPNSVSVLQKLTDQPVADIPYYHSRQNVDVAGIPCLVSRTGYTGEDGFELYLDAGAAPKLFLALMAAGEQEGILACGLGARDTLRLEARLPLYGHELSPEISPLEAGLGTFVKLQKAEFYGREALLQQKEQGVTRKLVGFELKDRGIARASHEVLAAGKKVGMVTSGTMSPTLHKSIGLALVEKEYGELGSDLFIDIRGKLSEAKVVKTPFYKRAK
ncbi:glycine cleavage system aminomethyltransferase GcvT [Sulfoacidibacillus thermotolerans]|uniref:glycine cleavage system aminomethyltransferase GcvT n=1 Tax=Sulfoacidibacillus thermotolerans TaxID=1765684 RepID=UPI000D692129|nr:glycine cleavage system aminomethyltransferase GcvT [Sulfoacidibacillus thermotolerans]